MKFWHRGKKIRLQDMLPPPPKKGGNNPIPLPAGTRWVSVSFPSPAKAPEPQGQCECCGNTIYSGIQECELCGKKICQDCTMVITKTMHNLGWGASTLMYVPGSTLPFQGSNISNPKAIPRDTVICISCADLLKLSLRIASTQGYDIEQKKEE